MWRDLQGEGLERGSKGEGLVEGTSIWSYITGGGLRYASRHMQFCYNKSDISYLKTSRAFDVLIHSVKPNSVG